MNEISKMTDVELTSAINVVTRQVKAVFLIGDRSERENLLAALYAEKKTRPSML